MDLYDLLPGSETLSLEAAAVDEEKKHVRLTLQSNLKNRCCPICGMTSNRTHSQYTRTLRDLSWADLSVVVTLIVHKLFCDNASCVRKIFTERLPEVVAPWARRTYRLAQTQVQVGLALGGQAGARLSQQLQIGASRETLLRLVRRIPLSKVASPRVLGIDDWAQRKGQAYGTILVDLETHQVIDLLPDRSPESTSEWLKAHPEIEIISRDRASEYALGATQGAPQAIQVADRWHLLKNLGTALRKALDPYRKQLKNIEYPAELSDSDTKFVNIALEASPVSQREQEKAQRQLEHQKRYETVLQLRQQGWTQKAIADHIGLSTKTIKRWLAAGRYIDTASRAKRGSLLDAYKPYILQQVETGNLNGAQLFREIRANGYQGGKTQVADFMAQLRQELGLPARSRTILPTSLSLMPPPLTPRRVSHLVFKIPHERTHEQQALLENISDQIRELQSTLNLVERFAQMTRQQDDMTLIDWLTEAQKIPGLKAFAKGIQQDYAAVHAALTMQWSNGQVEGQINRLKFIKRQMYGRAKFDLLRRRVLLAS